jgi:uncharacterized membrane protein
MKPTLRLLIATVVSLFALVSCSDYEKLESIEITPTVTDASDDTVNDIYICRANANNGYRKFEVIGHYNDDSTENLTSDSEWTTDASDDSYLSGKIPGMVYCKTPYGVIGILATYTLDNTGTGSTTSEDTEDFTDDVLVRAE